MEHPDITCIQRTGYPSGFTQPDHCGVDAMGTELMAGDEVIEIDGEIVLKDNIINFLKEFYDAVEREIE